MRPPRRHGGRTLVALAAAAAFTALTVPSAAQPTTAESFRDGLRGWKGHRASLKLVRRGVDARAVRVRLRPGMRRPSAFWIYRNPRPIARTERGASYRASAWVRTERGRSRLCLRVREVSGSRLVRARRSCSRATRRWRRLSLRYRAVADGSALGISVLKPRARRGDGFRVDRIALRRVPSRTRPANPPTPGTSVPTTAPPSPAPSLPVPAPAGGPAVGAQFHCTWSFYSNAARSAVLDKLASAGVRWVRMDVGWAGIEDRSKGSRNAWYIGMVDFCVDEARKRGMQVLVTLWLTPGWANGGRGDRVPPTNPSDYADFAAWAAAHWRGRVAAWEVWNEPDPWQEFWQGTTPEYVSLLKAAYPAFKSGDPAATVVLGGPSSNDDAWIRQVYSLGAKGSFDALATHPYQGIADAPPEHPDDGNRWWFTHLPAVRNVMLAYGDGDKPIWFTEMGWSAHADWSGVPNWQRGVTPEEQAAFFIRSIEYTKRNYPYVPVMFWYKERTNPSGGNVHLEGYGLLDGDLDERPILGALRDFLQR
jgi:polysaccharide biosynthesis protein PslG